MLTDTLIPLFQDDRSHNRATAGIIAPGVRVKALAAATLRAER